MMRFLAQFTPLFSERVWETEVLLAGTILSLRRRCSCPEALPP
jgi:hypothetical protein